MTGANNRVKKTLYEKKHYADLASSYSKNKTLIKIRLKEFKDIYKQGDDQRLFEELCFCICTAGASAKMGIRSIDAIRDVLHDGSLKQLQKRLRGVHRFPNKRPTYIVHTREYLKKEHGFKIKDLIKSFKNPMERRDFLAKNKNVKGIGYKESSHFLRNIGFTGYGILDKHILNTLYERDIIESPKPPSTRNRYIVIENKLKQFAEDMNVSMDELDLLLWREKTGVILK